MKKSICILFCLLLLLLVLGCGKNNNSEVGLSGDDEPKTYQKTWKTTEIIGDEFFVERTEKALELIKNQYPDCYDLVTNYVGIIEQYSESGMWAFENPPIFRVGLATYSSSTTWYASSIVHDSYHSKLYNDYLVSHDSVPAEIWRDMEAEMACLELQIHFLETIGAPEAEIEHAKSFRGENWWDIPRTW